MKAESTYKYGVLTAEFGEEFHFIPWHAVLQITIKKDRVPEEPKRRVVPKPPNM